MHTQDSYLHHQDDVLLALHQVVDQLLLTLVPFLILLIPALAGLTGRGSGGRTLLPKSRTKDTQDRHKITCNNCHSQAVQNIVDNLGTTHLTSSCEMYRS
jgi:hypothetical protein